jgi:ketosteroid isomerase-like protein
MTAHPNAAIVREGFDRLVQGDVAGLVGLFADDAVWHVPAANAMAGDYGDARRSWRSCAGRPS